MEQTTNWMKHSAQIVTLSAERLAYGSMPLEPAETRPRSNFPAESRVAFPRYDQLGTNYFGETAVKQVITYLSQTHY